MKNIEKGWYSSRVNNLPGCPAGNYLNKYSIYSLIVSELRKESTSAPLA
jgi:hypothetical protein